MEQDTNRPTQRLGTAEDIDAAPQNAAQKNLQRVRPPEEQDSECDSVSLLNFDESNAQDSTLEMEAEDDVDTEPSENVAMERFQPSAADADVSSNNSCQLTCDTDAESYQEHNGSARKSVSIQQVREPSAQTESTSQQQSNMDPSTVHERLPKTALPSVVTDVEHSESLDKLKRCGPEHSENDMAFKKSSVFDDESEWTLHCVKQENVELNTESSEVVDRVDSYLSVKDEMDCSDNTSSDQNLLDGKIPMDCAETGAIMDIATHSSSQETNAQASKRTLEHYEDESRCSKRYKLSNGSFITISSVMGDNLDIERILYDQPKVCLKRLIVEEQVSNHMESDHVDLPDLSQLEQPNGTVQCPGCEKVMSTWSNLQMHLHRFHKTLPLHYYCKRCELFFMKANSILHHMYFHHNEKVPLNAVDQFSTQHAWKGTTGELEKTMTKDCNNTLKGNDPLHAESSSSGKDLHQNHLKNYDHVMEGLEVKTQSSSLKEKNSPATTPISVKNNIIKCPSSGCQMTFKIWYNFQKHLQKCHPTYPTPYRCVYCKKGFVKDKGMYHHLIQAHNSRSPKDLYNSTCKMTKTPPKMDQEKPEVVTKDHQNSRPADESYSVRCPKCSFEGNIEQPHILDRHFRQKHGSKHMPYHCRKCSNLGFFLKESFLNHVRRFHKDAKLGKVEACTGKDIVHCKVFNQKKKSETTCPECNECFDESRLVEAHFRVSHDEEKMKRVCPICKVRFLFKSRRNNHMMKSHGILESDLGDYEDSDEEQHTSNSTKLDSNEILLAVDDGICPRCQKEFTELQMLEVHFRMCHDENDFPFLCEVCNKGFLTQFGITQHMAVHDSESSKSTTAVPEAESTKTGKLSEEEVELAKNTLICPRCSVQYKYSDVKSLEIHYRCSHDEEAMPAHCSLCGKGFLSQKRCDNHLFHYHQKAKNKSAKRSKTMMPSKASDLKYSKHTKPVQDLLKKYHGLNKKKPKCPECAKSFITWRGMVQHFRKWHDEQKMPYSCKVCALRFFTEVEIGQHHKVMHKSDTSPSEKTDSDQKMSSTCSSLKGNDEQTVTSPNENSDSDKKISSGLKGNDTPKVPVTSPSEKSETDKKISPSLKGNKPKVTAKCHTCGIDVDLGSGFKEMNRLEQMARIRIFCKKCKTSKSPAKRRPDTCTTHPEETATSSSPVAQRKSPRETPKPENSDIVIVKHTKLPQCPECGKTFDTYIGRDRHFRKDHPDIQMPYVCDKCPLGYFNITKLEMHKQRYHNELKSPPELKTAVSSAARKSFAEKKTRVLCPACHERFSSRRARDRHYRRLHGQDGMPLHCHMCQTGFFNKEMILGHYKRVHGVRREEVEEMLDMIPAYEDLYESHTSTQAAPDEAEQEAEDGSGSIFCTLCQQVFTSLAKRNVHMKVIHNQQCLCETCGQGFDSEELLENHMKAEHSPTVEKINVLPSFKHKQGQGLVRNITDKLKQKYSMQKKVVCPKCEKIFYNDKNVLRHFRLAHGDSEMPFKCSQCSRGYLKKSSLLSHIKKSYGCHNQIDSEDSSSNVSSHQPAPVHVRSKWAQLFHKDTNTKSPASTVSEATADDVSVDMVDSNLKDNAVESNLKCQICHVEFPSRASLTSHELEKLCCPIKEDVVMEIKEEDAKDVETHSPEKKQFVHICKICTMALPTEGSLKFHMQRYHNQVIQKPTCDICAKTFESEDMKFEHVGKEHPAALKCFKCGSQVDGIGGLKKHFNLVHGQESTSSTNKQQLPKPPVPELTNSPTVEKNQPEAAKALVGSLKLHHGKVVSKCPKCPMEFTTAAKRNSHFRKCHNGNEMPYICPNCNKGFLQAKSLYGHRSTCNLKYKLKIHMAKIGNVASKFMTTSESPLQNDESPQGRKNRENPDECTTTGRDSEQSSNGRSSEERTSSEESEKIRNEDAISKEIRRQHQCPKCFMCFFSSKRMENHACSPPSTEHVSCVKCGHLVKVVEFHIHFKMVHMQKRATPNGFESISQEIKRQHICPKCFFWFYPKEIMDNHTCSPPSTEKVKCVICHQQIIVNEYQDHFHREHMDTREPSNDNSGTEERPASTESNINNQGKTSIEVLKQHQCLKCLLCFDSSKKMRNHTCSPQTSELVQCMKCDKKLMVGDFHEHFRTAHLDVATCLLCKVNLNGMGALDFHLLGHGCRLLTREVFRKAVNGSLINPTEGKVACPLCDIALMCQLEAEEHFQEKHPEIPCPFQCKECSERFLFWGSVVAHKCIVHHTFISQRFPLELQNTMKVDSTKFEAMNLLWSSLAFRSSVQEVSVLHESPPYAMQCMLCSKACPRLADVIWHMAKFHPNMYVDDLHKFVYARYQSSDIAKMKLKGTEIAPATIGLVEMDDQGTVVEDCQIFGIEDSLGTSRALPAPKNVNGYCGQSESFLYMVITWDRVVRPNTTIIGYSVLYSNDSKTSVVSVPPENLFCVIRGLTEHSVYKVWVCAVTKDHSGTPSEPITVLAIEHTDAEPPTIVSALWKNSTAIEVQWKNQLQIGHSMDQSIRKTYRIYYAPVGKEDQEQYIEVYSTNTCGILSSLDGGVEYKIWMRTMGESGMGQPSSRVHVKPTKQKKTKNPPQPLTNTGSAYAKVVATIPTLSPNVMERSGASSSDVEAQFEGVIIADTPSSSGPIATRSRSASSPVSALSTIKNQLQVMLKENQRLPLHESLGKVSVTPLTDTTISVSWPPTTRQAPFDKVTFKVKLLKALEATEHVITMPPDKYGLILRNLEPDTNYVIRVTATDKSGNISLTSKNHLVKTRKRLGPGPRRSASTVNKVPIPRTTLSACKPSSPAAILPKKNLHPKLMYPIVGRQIMLQSSQGQLILCQTPQPGIQGSPKATTKEAIASIGTVPFSGACTNAAMASTAAATVTNAMSSAPNAISTLGIPSTLATNTIPTNSMTKPVTMLGSTRNKPRSAVIPISSPVSLVPDLSKAIVIAPEQDEAADVQITDMSRDAILVPDEPAVDPTPTVLSSDEDDCCIIMSTDPIPSRNMGRRSRPSRGPSSTVNESNPLGNNRGNTPGVDGNTQSNRGLGVHGHDQGRSQGATTPSDEVDDRLVIDETLQQGSEPVGEQVLDPATGQFVNIAVENNSLSRTEEDMVEIATPTQSSISSNDLPIDLPSATSQQGSEHVGELTLDPATGQFVPVAEAVQLEKDSLRNAEEDIVEIGTPTPSSPSSNDLPMNLPSMTSQQDTEHVGELTLEPATGQFVTDADALQLETNSLSNAEEYEDIAIHTQTQSSTSSNDLPMNSDDNVSRPSQGRSPGVLPCDIDDLPVINKTSQQDTEHVGELTLEPPTGQFVTVADTLQLETNSNLEEDIVEISTATQSSASSSKDFPMDSDANTPVASPLTLSDLVTDFVDAKDHQETSSSLDQAHESAGAGTSSSKVDIPGCAVLEYPDQTFSISPPSATPRIITDAIHYSDISSPSDDDQEDTSELPAKAQESVAVGNSLTDVTPTDSPVLDESDDPAIALGALQTMIANMADTSHVDDEDKAKLDSHVTKSPVADNISSGPSVQGMTIPDQTDLTVSKSEPSAFPQRLTDMVHYSDISDASDVDQDISLPPPPPPLSQSLSSSGMIDQSQATQTSGQTQSSNDMDCVLCGKRIANETMNQVCQFCEDCCDEILA